MFHTDHSSQHSKFGTVKPGWLSKLGLMAYPTVKVYHGYGRDGQLQVFGHVFSLAPRPRRTYNRNVLRNMWALIRLFVVRPKADAAVHLVWQGERIDAVTAKDGFFHFQWAPQQPTDAGWHTVTVAHTEKGEVLAEGEGSIYIPYRTQYGCISDIDDTFLVSHSSRLLKRLYLLFTRNARTRRPFEGVAQHYSLLGTAGTTEDVPNPFFYVSSSEWNLYNYIREFSRTHGLPEGVYLLSQVKRVTQLLATGQGKHATKFTRISRIMENYPSTRFVLLGDDTQQDPAIYLAIARHFPERVLCVYLRQVRKAPAAGAQAVVAAIRELGVECCYFRHSEEAIAHSRETGLIGG